MILFMDEPLSGLDGAAATNMMKLIRDLSKKGLYLFLTTIPFVYFFLIGTKGSFFAKKWPYLIAFLHRDDFFCENFPEDIERNYFILCWLAGFSQKLFQRIFRSVALLFDSNEDPLT